MTLLKLLKESKIALLQARERAQLFNFAEHLCDRIKDVERQITEIETDVYLALRRGGSAKKKKEETEVC